MQYDVSTPEAYLNTIEADWRKEKLLLIREMIFKHAPQITESIAYKMLAYGTDTTTIFHLNAQKHYVSLYVGDIKKINLDLSLLDGLDYGKGCIRIRKSIDLKQSKLNEFIETTIQLWQEHQDTSC